MDKQSFIEVQKNGIMMHRLIYVIFFLQRLLLHFQSETILLRNTIVIISFIVLCEIVEEICNLKNYFNNAMVVSVIRYIESVACTVIMTFFYDTTEPGTIVVALLIMFVTEFYVAQRTSERNKAITNIILISIPILVVLTVRMTINPNEYWMFLFFDMLLVLGVLAVESISFVDYMSRIDKKILDQHHEFEQIVEKNENILNMQEKIKNTNTELNLQKLDLQKANTQIREANEEMIAQAEIMHYIAMSFDVSKISNQITDSIMQVKKLGFCAVYIKEGVYLNKYANYVIKTNIAQLQSKIKDVIEPIFTEMNSQNVSEKVYHGGLKEDFPFLRDVNINSVYIKVLGVDDENYGLFMVGDTRRGLFKDNMSFYDAIIAQYDIAITNAKIYNEMQHMARTDGLTGINNRVYFNQLFRETAAKVKERNGRMSVALFDIDKFKNVNDTYGHLAGDEVIKRIASVTEKCISKYDGFICRYGGEEFVAVLPERKLEVAQPIIDELFDEICKQVVVYNEYEIHMSVSIGLTAYPEVCQDTERLLKRADWCMYYAKEHGRNQIKVDDGEVENCSCVTTRLGQEG